MIRLRAEACARHASPLARCSQCADACPRGALALGRGAPVVADSCDDCGVCAGACPSGAIEDPVAPLSARSVGCAFADHPAEVRVPCLAALSLPRLASWIASAPGLHLVHGRCEGCPRGRAAPVVKRLLRRAELLSTALGRAPGALRVSMAPVAPRPVEPPRRQPGLSRRGLFGLLRPAAATPPAPSGRRALLEALEGQRVALPAEAGVAFRFRPPDACDGCAVCARLCPTSALGLVATGAGGQALTFSPGQCHGCGLCVDVCRPPGARLEPIDLQPRSLRGPGVPVPVVTLRRRRCARCQAEFSSPVETLGVEQCFVCAEGSRAGFEAEQVY